MDPISVDSLSLRRAALLARSFAARSRMTPEEWAEEVYRLPNGQRFRWAYAPYALGMFRSLFQRNVIETSYMLYSRGLKSTVALLAIGYVIDQAPRRILSLWPTNSQAEKWSKDILTGELFDTTPRLNYLGNKSGKRIASNTLLHKLFPGGLVDIFGANAAGDMRRAKGSFLYGEEIDAIDTTTTDEGDQLAIFSKRGDEYPDTIRLWASYPSIKGGSRIASKIETSDHNQWQSTCLRCGGQPFVMHRSMVIFDEEKPEGARMQCPRCKELLTDPERYQMAHRQGADNWRPLNEFRGRRGFHGGAMLWPHPVDPVKYPGGFLQLMAEQEIAARRSEDPGRSLRVLVNTVDAEPYDPTHEDERPPDWLPLYTRRKTTTEIPEGGLVITGAADLQLGRIEIEWKAWGREERSWGLKHVTIDGDIRDPGTWKLFKIELGRKFQHALGVEMGFSLFFIDGGKWGDRAYQFLGEIAREPIEGITGKVRAVKGVVAPIHPIVSDWRAVSKNLKGYHVGTWQIKDLINRRLALRWDGSGEAPMGWMEWNTSFEQPYFQQLCTGHVTVVYEKGEEVRKFLNERELRDEGLDLNVYNYAAFRRRQWDFDMIEADLKQRAAAKNGPAEAPKREQPAATSRSWALGGNKW